MMKNQVSRIAALLAVPLFGSAALAATDGAHLIDRGVGADGASSVAYSTCTDPEEECIVAELGCSATNGWFQLYDGKDSARRLLEAETPAMAFHVGSDRFESRVWHFENEVNELNGGWAVKIEGADMEPIFATIIQHPNATLAVDVAGERAFDLTPAEGDRAAMSKLAETCLRAIAVDPNAWATLDLGI